MLHNNDDSETVPLTEAQIREMMNEVDEGDFTLMVTFLNPETGTPSINFDLSKKGLKRGGIFSWHINSEEGSVDVTVKGQISSTTLRKGVAPVLESEYKNQKLRLEAFNYKGGEWAGFRAPIIGQSEKSYDTWHVIENWEVK